MLEVDVVFGAVFEALGEDAGEAEEFALADAHGVEDGFVAAVHFCAGDFVGAAGEFALEGLAEAPERFGG